MEKEIIKDLLPTLLEELKETLEKYFHVRELSFPDVPRKISVAVGMRRTGKTFFLYQQIRQLLVSKIPWQRILYINFEDDRLLPMDQQGLASLIDSFYTLYPENHDQLLYLFLDEIQNVKDWPLVVRRFFDTKKIKIFLSGSSAKLLSKEIASALRGRSLATEIWPYSFSEFLQFREKALPTPPFGKKVRDQLAKELSTYLQHGGFPEVQTMDTENRIRILQDYVNLVVLRDIVERYEISNISLIRSLLKALIGSVGKPFSVNKVFNDLKSQGYPVSKNTLYDYLGYIEDAYLAFTVPLFSPSFRKQQVNPKKVYLIDPGLLCASRLIAKEDWGILFENLIYLDLRRKHYRVFYYLTKERYEVDFVAQDNRGQSRLIQVSWSMENLATREREQRALWAAEKELGLRSQLVTVDNYFEFSRTL